MKKAYRVCGGIEKVYMKCSFCANKIPTGRGKMFVKTDGRAYYFCNSKCQKNFKLGRDGKNLKWTEKQL